jgi:hypothetical protein
LSAHRHALVALAAVALGKLACIRGGAFTCSASAECVSGDLAGVCQPEGVCSFPDATCASGQRFGELAGSLSNTCVGGDGIDAPGLTFTVGGTITGLAGSVVLNNNGGDSLTRTMDGPFTFATPIANGATYSVSIATQPSGQICNLSAATGSIDNAPVTDVGVLCGAGDGILCATDTFCVSATQECCYNRTAGSGVCQDSAALCGNQTITCDDASDCGGGTAVCCARYQNMQPNIASASCETAAASCTPAGNGFVEILCDPTEAAPCPGALTCTGVSAATNNPGWRICI